MDTVPSLATLIKEAEAVSKNLPPPDCFSKLRPGFTEIAIASTKVQYLFDAALKITDEATKASMNHLKAEKGSPERDEAFERYQNLRRLITKIENYVAELFDKTFAKNGKKYSEYIILQDWTVGGMPTATKEVEAFDDLAKVLENEGGSLALITIKFPDSEEGADFESPTNTNQYRGG